MFKGWYFFNTLFLKSLVHSLANLQKGFLDDSSNVEQVRRIYLLFFISTIGILTLIPLGILALKQGILGLGILDLILAFILIGNLFHVRRYKKYTLNIYIGIFFTSILFIYALLTGGVNNTAFVWYYTYPLIASFLLGSKRGAIATGVLILTALVFFFMKNPPPFLASYNFDFKIRFVTSFLVVFAFSYLFESSREKTRKKLQEAQEDLEKRVEERTSALKEALQDLRGEMDKRHRIEEALRESEGKYRTILEDMEEGYYEADLYGNVTFCNDSFCRIWGYSKEKLIGMNYKEGSDPESSKKLYEVFNKVYRTGEPIKGFDWQIIRQDGTGRYVEVSVSLKKGANGKPVGFRGIVHDITKRKQAEEELTQSRETFATIFDSIDADIYIGDMKTYHILFMNKHMKDSFGDDLVGTICHRSFRNLPSPCPHCTNSKLLDAEGHPTGLQVWEGLNPITNQSYINYDRAIQWVDGRFVRLHVATDITDLKKAEQAKASLEEQLRQSQKIEAVGRLAGGIAHDFNNLLTIIKGYTELSLTTMTDTDPMGENLKEIQKAAQRAADLTRQLLAFSRRQILEMKVLDLNATLQEMKKMLNRVIGEDIELVTSFFNPLGRVKTDPGQIEQVILNLSINARDAMPKGGKFTIETANVYFDKDHAHSNIGMKPGHFVMLAVRDTGVGMPREVQEKIFEPFFTTKEKGQGTGLGLSTVYGIVKQSEGYILVDSEPGRGSTFRIYFPQVEEDTPAGSNEEELSPHEPQGRERILLVEDESSLRKLAAQVLRKQGYKVLEAANGEEALKVSLEQAREEIHLLLTDVVMPHLSGKELADKLSPLRPEMRVLYTSGYTDNAIVHHGVLNPGIDYLPKPFSPSLLIKRVRDVLGK